MRRLACCLAFATAAAAAQIGAGNARAADLARQSPRVESARRLLIEQARRIRDPIIRAATLDAIENPATCVRHRSGLTQAQTKAILSRLRDEGLLGPGDPAGVFPPLAGNDAACPKLPQPFAAAPGSGFHGHHSYPGGLMLHETFNLSSSLHLAESYREVYGPDLAIAEDIVIAAPIWHDWAKTFVFQWNSDGTEFTELNFGGAGADSTGAHHILGLAEAMARGLPPDFVITLASAHAAPTLGNERKVAGWIRAAAIIARVDPIERGYLRRDDGGAYHLATVRRLGAYTNILVEYVLHALSDSDFSFTVPAMSDVETMLAALAPGFGFDPADASAYNNRFRNVVLSRCSAERLLILYGNGGLEAVKAEVGKIRF